MWPYGYEMVNNRAKEMIDGCGRQFVGTRDDAGEEHVF